MAPKKKNEFLTYKNRPLVRVGDTLYYGDMSEKFVVMFKILSTKELNGTEVTDKVLVSLINTDPDVRPHERIVQKIERRGLYAAMDIGSTWLERALLA